ncbi:MAG: hypothetical protein LBR79_00555 [Oscillospiraceae bacterium]|nr:hypothetical protein [Oscillospiraceae bacterium]
MTDFWRWSKLVDNISPPPSRGGEKKEVSIILRHNRFFRRYQYVKWKKYDKQ